MSDVTAVPIKPVKKSWIVWLGLGIGAAALAGVGLAFTGTAKPVAQAGGPEAFLAYNKGKSGIVTTASGLQYQVMKPGEGAKPTDTDVALIKYKGTLRDGKVFDENERAPLPVNGVVPGFAEAMKLMSKGAVYRVWIPPALGYGDQDMGDGAIPANSVLIFDIEMLDFRSQAEIQAQMQALQAQQALQGGATGGLPGGPPQPR